MPLEPIRFERQSRFYERQLVRFEKWGCDPAFLRFVFTRSLAEWTPRDRTAIYRSASGTDVALNAAAKLEKAMRKANRDWEHFDEKDYCALERIVHRAASIQSFVDIPGSAVRPRAARRLYFMSAMIPYLRWKKPRIPEGRDHSEEGPMWDWLTDWERGMGALPLPDKEWHEDKLFAGGFGPEDLLQFRPMTKYKPPKKKKRKQTVWRWWRLQRRNPELIEWIVRYGASFIAWKRRLHQIKRTVKSYGIVRREGVTVRTVGSEGSLRRGEGKFARSAAKTVRMHCERAEAAVLKAWGKIYF